MSEKTQKRKRKVSKQQAVVKLWELGDLSYKLKGVQENMRNLVYESIHDISVFLCSRQTGKSYTMCLIGTEFCQRNANVKVLLLFPKKKDCKRVVKEHMRIIHEDCPEHMKPEHKVADNTFVYPNGSEIIMAGTDGGSAESVRGSTLHLILMDEAGFHDYNDFMYIVNSILMPTLTTTDGKVIMASTPSKEPDHPFMTEFVEPYRAEGWLVEYDIDSNPLIDDKMRKKIIKRYPLGEEDPEYQREYLLITRVTNSSMVVPEWNSIEEDVVKASELPVYYDAYVSCDPAVSHLTGIIFGYYDYLRKKLVILDEVTLGGPEQKTLQTKEIANAIMRKENNLFLNQYTGEVKTPYMRIIDNNLPLLVNDLKFEHGLQFLATEKRGKEDRINQLRLMMQRGEVEIHPRCKELIEHIRSARWNKKRDKFAENKGNSKKGIKPNHSDLLDALVYLARNFHPHKNPYPEGYFEMRGSNVFDSRLGQKLTKNQELMHSIMNSKPKNNN